MQAWTFWRDRHPGSGDFFITAWLGKQPSSLRTLVRPWKSKVGCHDEERVGGPGGRADAVSRGTGFRHPGLGRPLAAQTPDLDLYPRDPKFEACS